MSQHPDLPYEQAKNAEYLERLKDTPSRSTSGVSMAASRAWVDPAGTRRKTQRILHPLIGRIGFDSEDELLGRSCYIGPSRMNAGELQVVSWDAPVSQLFFGTGRDGFTVDGELAARRTFDHDLADITDIDDEWILSVDPSPFASAELRVPTPTSTLRRRRIRLNVEDGHSHAVERGAESATSGNSLADPTARTNGHRAAPNAGRSLVSSHLTGMRAAETVLKKLAAPRSNVLRSVLSTLQPDQFDVVSSPPGCHLIVQGHPGTGKTVVAAYRAAYLISAERKDEQASSVLLIGPTNDYVAHVSELLRPLDPQGRVVVTHIAALLERTVDLKIQWTGGIGGDHNDVDARAGQFATKAEILVRETSAVRSGPTARRDHIEAIYSLIRSNGLRGRLVSSDSEDSAWMQRLPPFDQALGRRRYLPLMAQITLTFQPVPFTDQVPHILIDEAQDISPIEWNVLERYLRPHGRWTLVGDMNQRRSDTTYASWAQISDHLGLGDGDKAMQPTVLRRGYRSTVPILRFADKLLPASERGATSVQIEGPPPRVEYVASLGSIFRRAIDEARRLIQTYPDGTVAVITVDPGSLIKLLGKHGWRRGENLNAWSREGEVLRVFVPELARGLEFDGVVVVEPGAFPENLGREGQLYTSLTRANRELAVVWHRNLPDALRKAGRQ